MFHAVVLSSIHCCWRWFKNTWVTSCNSWCCYVVTLHTCTFIVKLLRFLNWSIFYYVCNMQAQGCKNSPILCHMVCRRRWPFLLLCVMSLLCLLCFLLYFRLLMYLGGSIPCEVIGWEELQNFCACCLWLWLGAPPAGSQNPKGKGQFWGFLPHLQCIVQYSIYDPYINGWTDRDAVRVGDSGGP